jgi:hypothetical protein
MVSESPPITVDLVKAVKRTKGVPVNLQKDVAELDRFASIFADLRLAARMFQMSVMMASEKTNIEFSQPCVSALFAYAIILYGRAVGKKNSRRLMYQIRPHLSTVEIQRHDLIIKLRDNAIAHLGLNDSSSVKMRRDSIFLIIENNNTNLKTVSVNTTFNNDDLLHIAEQITKVAHIMFQIMMQRYDNVVKSISALQTTEPLTYARLIAQSDDLACFMGDAAAAEEVIANRQDGLHAGSYFNQNVA